MLKNLLASSPKKNAAKKLRQLIDTEQHFLSVDFGLEFLEEEMGLDKKILSKLIEKEYGMDFYTLLRKLRIGYLRSFVSKYGDSLSLSDYAKFTGHKEVSFMLHALKQETGLDFDDFCRYSITVEERTK